MKEHYGYINKRAAAAVSGYAELSSRTALSPVLPALTGELAEKLSKLSESVFEKMLMERAYGKQLLLAYVRGEETENLSALKQGFAEELLERGDDILRTENPELLELLRHSEQRYTAALEEFCVRFEKDREKIETSLLGGRSIGRLTELRLLLGDEHNHGRATALVVTDAGRFIYRPRDMRIDEISALFFRQFFPEVTRLPKTVICDGYGYCGYVENEPARTWEEAAEYYRNVGKLTAIILLLRSRDLHIENILASKTCPVPIDLEMMISPLETGVKMGASPKDVNWEQTVCGSGFLSYRIGEFETGVLFSTSDRNLSAPVLDGKRMTVADFEGEFLTGFEAGYRRMLRRKEEICDFFLSRPPVKIRILMRGTQAYATLMLKMRSYDWIQDKNKRESVAKALENGFDKLGEKRRAAIVGSETEALMEQNVPIFYAVSTEHGLWDGEKLLYDGYFEISAVENVVRTLNAASERELRFETDLLKKAVDRMIQPRKAGPIHTVCLPAAGETDFLKTACGLADGILADAVETPHGDLLWFGMNDRYSMAMNCPTVCFGMGCSGIAAFLAAVARACAGTSRGREYAAVCGRLLLRLREMLESFLCLKEPYFENVMPAGVERGLGGLLLGNELAALYSGNPVCDDIRRLCLSVLERMDFSFCRNDMLNGAAGLVRVLCGFDTLFGAERVPETVGNLCALLLSRRESLRGGGLLWKSADRNAPNVIAFPGFADGPAGIGCALSLAGKKLGRKEFADAAEEAFALVDGLYDETSGRWQSLWTQERKEYMDAGALNGAAGVGFTMLGGESGTAKRNLKRAIEACRGPELMYSDTLRDGNCCEIDFLVEAACRLERPELLQSARDKLARVIGRAEREGGFRYIREPYRNFFESGLTRGAAGVGWTCLRCMEPDAVKSIYRPR